MAALVLPMMVMTSCKKEEAPTTGTGGSGSTSETSASADFFIKTWTGVVQNSNITTTYIYNIQRGGTFQATMKTSSENSIQSTSGSGTWKLVNNNEVTYSYSITAADGRNYTATGTLRRSGNELLWVEMNLMFK